MENTFATGDRVRIKNRNKGAFAQYTSDELDVGQTGVISQVLAPGIGYEVLMDNGHVSDEFDPSWPFFHDELELVQ